MNGTIDHIQFIVIDLFCGAGGTTTGFEEAEFDYDSMYRFLKSIGIDPPKTWKVFCKVAKVVACVNHDPIAIKSHWSNHPEVEHFEEDITTLYGFTHRNGILFKSAQFIRMVRVIEMYRAFYPEAKIVLSGSLECTNFSKAKGGLPRNADSRTLAEHLYPYIIAIDPHYIKIENVVEFMSWGPLDKKGKPISRKNGRDWLRWRRSVCDLGYRDEWRELNAADFGALTSRNRLFGCFAKPDLPIAWPKPTHAKNPEKTSLYKPLKKWEPVKKALDFSDEGNSVFNRKKPLSTKTMQRLFMGCVKHIAGGKDNFHSVDEPAGVVRTNNCLSLVKACFISKAYSGRPEDKSSSIENPSPAITTVPHESLVQASFITKAFSANSGKSVNPGSSTEEPCPTVAVQNRLGVAFIQKYNSNRDKTGGNNGHSIDEPAPTVACQPRLALAKAEFISRYNGVNGGKHDNSQSVEGPVGAPGCSDQHAKVSASFIQKYYSNGGQHNSIDEPASTISTKDRLSKVSAFFLDKQFSGSDNHQSIEQPAGAILPNDKHNLIQAEKWIMNTNYNNIGSSIEEPSPVITADRHAHYLINPSWGGNSGSVEEPCHVVIARQDKAPLYFITCTFEKVVAVPVYEGDCEWTIKLKEFMALYGIADIKMRMLKVMELKIIQGFPENYILLGNQADQKKAIGNAVHPKVAKYMAKADSERLIELALAKVTG